jgi:hypothetical protein
MDRIWPKEIVFRVWTAYATAGLYVVDCSLKVFPLPCLELVNSQFVTTAMDVRVIDGPDLQSCVAGL